MLSPRQWFRAIFLVCCGGLVFAGVKFFETQPEGRYPLAVEFQFMHQCTQNQSQVPPGAGIATGMGPPSGAISAKSIEVCTCILQTVQDLYDFENFAKGDSGVQKAFVDAANSCGQSSAP
jgi:hypothetical protein